MWRVLYNILIVAVSPVIVAILLVKQRCRRGLLFRLGLRVTPLSGPGRPTRPVIWVHAVSLGEVMAVTPLVKELHRRHPDHTILVSTVTETGREAVEQRLAGIAEHRYAPLDLPWAVSRTVARWRPALYLFVETELWPNLLWQLHDRGVPTVLVNGRLSSRSFARQHVRGLLSFYRSVLRTLTLCLMQSERDAERIVALGADPSRVKRTGNIKFDQPMPAASADPSWRAALGIGAHESLILAGSTHAGEEEILVAAYRDIVVQHPKAILMMAPRHIERVDAVMEMVRTAGLPVQRKSRLDGRAAGPRVVILDTRGELARAYGEAVVAFVGGTLVPVGGHNLLEPAAWGTPVLFGPHTDHCAEIASLLSESGGGRRILSSHEVAETVSSWLRDDTVRRQVGDAARRTVAENQGALTRSLDYIDDYVRSALLPHSRSVDREPAPAAARR